MGRTVAYNNIDWVALYHNLWKTQRRWVMVGKVVAKTRSTVWAQGILYKSVVQLELLYGRVGWVVTGFMLKVLEVFHHRVARMIAGMTPRRTTIGEWE